MRYSRRRRRQVGAAGRFDRSHPLKEVSLKRFLTLCLACLPLQASAEVMHYSKCKTNDGKTIADVQTWLNDWRALAKKAGVEYRVRLLAPHADSQLGAGEFFIEGGSPTLASYAKAWDWWYTNADAAASNRQLIAAATCDSGAVYRSTD
jgi:hypothetical protein